MDRGIPTEEVLLEMQQADPQIRYLVGTPKGRLTRREAELVNLPWQQARPAVRVKLLPKEQELYVFVESQDRLQKERAMRLRKLRQIAGGLSPRSVLEKFATMQMMDVFFPTEQPGKELLFRRYTQPDKDHQMLLTQLGWQLPEQPPPKISAQGQLLR